MVSFNLCADQLVVALADPEQIAGLRPMPTDPALSVVADKARAFRRLDWQAESTIALEPDLVLIGPNDRSVTRRMLASQGLRVVEVGFVSDLESARRQIREMAALLGHPERGEKLIAELERARARLAAAARERRSHRRWWSSAAAIRRARRASRRRCWRKPGSSRRPARPRAMAGSSRWRNFWC